MSAKTLKGQIRAFVGNYTANDRSFFHVCAEKAVERAQQEIDSELEISDYFVGRADLLHHIENDKVIPYIIEMNGSSSRGLSTIPQPFFSHYLDGFINAINTLTEEVELILVPTLDDDELWFEADMLVEHLIGQDYSAVKMTYSEIARETTVENGYLHLGDKEEQQVTVISREGVLKRHEVMREELSHTKIINPAYWVTDDKGETYRAIERFNQAYNTNIQVPEIYEKVKDRNELPVEISKVIERGKIAVVKPFGGSGAAGIGFFKELDEFDQQFDELYNHFQRKYGGQFSYFPATVSSCVEANTIYGRVYDLGVYLAFIEGEIYPVGIIGRTAPEQLGDISQPQRLRRVVNLSQHGRVEFDRAVSMKPEVLKKAGIGREELIKTLKTAVLGAYAVNEYSKGAI